MSVIREDTILAGLAGKFSSWMGEPIRGGLCGGIPNDD